jgi:hypothetical protein
MYKTKILHPQHPDNPSYEALLQNKFSNLKDNRNPINCHIVVEKSNEWVAGASLAHQDFLENDPDVNDLWEVKKVTNCSRILRLWSNNSTTLPRLLKAIKQQIPEENFIYGILSVSQRFAIENQNLFKTNINLAKPRYEVQDSQVDPGDFATSEGQRLIQVYKQFNAEFLGPIAANPSDQAVRLLMGTSLKQNHEPHFWKRYETNF